MSPSERVRGHHPWARLALAWATVASCAPSTPEQATTAETVPPNVVLVTLDTTRADHLPTYGYFRDTAPEFDRLARESLVFERCIAPMATTLPTHLSMLTGTYPLEHGVLANSISGGRQYVMSESLSSVAEALGEAGYKTGGFVSGAPLNRGTGAARGYQEYGQPANMDRRSEDTVDEALEWLAGMADSTASEAEPFHLWVHLFDAHWPFHPPEQYQGFYETDADLQSYVASRGIHHDTVRPMVNARETSTDMINAYDSALRYQDVQFGRLIDALRQREDWERTVVIVIGDHGEGLGQHGQAAHGHVWDEQLRVPMIVRLPGELPRTVSRTLSTVDVFPTVLARLVSPAREALGGQASGQDVLRDEFTDRPAFSQETGRSRDLSTYRFTLTSNTWKYQRVENLQGGFEEVLFDLTTDPYELRDVSGEQTAITEQLRKRLLRMRKRQNVRARQLHESGRARTRPIDEEAQRRLRALGYVDEGE